MGLELVITPDPVDRRRRDPVAAASRRTLQCVAPVRRRLERLGEHTLNLVIVDLPRAPRPRRVTRPSSPRSQKLRRHNPTVGNDTPTSAAICVFDAPSDARNTIRARIACCCDADGVRNTARNSRSSSSDSSIAAATRATNQPYRNSLTNTRD